MSTTIDNRVVEMNFDNQQFEKNVRTSINTLDELEESLQLEKASRGLESVEKAAKKVDFSPISKSIDAVQIKIVALNTAIDQTVRNITNQITHTAKKMVSALTVDPIKSGFSEYETQINATQTILANTQKEGATIDDVNAALDELNKYADLTIYNFTEMTKNIGTFTAAGVDLKTSVSAIQGIANLAAVSGSTSQQASTAMYQLSQALSSGTVKLMDWNSVVNAGMGGQVFQDALKDTARLHGIAIDQMIEKEGSFRETLQNEWLTADILTETLSKFTTSGVNEYLASNSDLSLSSIETMREEAVATGDATTAFKEMAKTIAETSSLSEDQIYNLLNLSQTAEEAATKVKTFSQLWDVLKEAAQSGWSQTWRTVVGDFEEAKETLTEFADELTSLLNESSEKRNEKLAKALSSGWKLFLDEGISDAAGFQEAMIESAKNSGVAIDEIVKKAGSFEKSLKDGWVTSDILASSVSNLASKITDLSDEELDALGYTRAQAEALLELNKKIQNGTIDLDEYAKKMSMSSGRENLINSIKNVFDYIMSIVTPIREAFSEVFGVTAEQIYNFTESLKNLTAKLKLSSEQIAKIKSTFKGLFAIANIVKRAFLAVSKIFSPLLNLFGDLASKVFDVTGSFGDWLVALDESIEKNETFIRITTKVADAIEKVIDFLKPAISAISKFGVALISNAGKAISSVKEKITSLLNSPLVAGIVEKVRNIFAAVSGIMGSKFSDTKVAFSEFLNRLKELNGFTLENIKAALSDFWNNVVKPLFDLDGLFQKLKDSFTAFTSGLSTELQKVADALSSVWGYVSKILEVVKENWTMIFAILYSLAIYKFVNKLSSLLSSFTSLVAPVTELINSVTGVFSSIKSAISTWTKSLKAKNLVYLASAVAILAASLIAIANFVPTDRLWEVTAVIVALAGALTGFATLLSKVNFSGWSTASVLLFAGALLILAIALKQLEGIKNYYTILTELGALAALLVVATGVLSKIAPELSWSAVALLILAVSLNSVINVIKKLNEIEFKSTENIINGLLTTFLALIGAAAVIRLAGAYMARVGAGVALIAVGIVIMSSVIEKLASIPKSEFEQGMSAIKSMLLIFVAIIAVSAIAGSSNTAKAGAGILAMSAAIMLLVMAIKILGKADYAAVTKGKKVIYEMLAVFAGIVLLSKYAGEHAAKAGLLILAMSASILLLVGAIFILGLLDPTGVDQAMKAIAKISACFALLIASTQIASTTKDYSKELTKLVLAVGLMTMAIVLLSAIEENKLKAASNALTEVMAAFALVVASTHLAGTAKTTLWQLMATIGVLGLVLYALGALPADAALTAAKALTLVLTAFTASFVIISNFGKTTTTIQSGLILMMGIVFGLAAVLAGLSSLPMENAMTIATALSTLLLSFSAACVILGYVGKMSSGIDAGIIALGKLVLGAGLFVSIFAAFAKLVPNMADDLDKGIEILRKFGEGLGAIIGGFLAGVLSGLPQIGAYLSDFATNAQDFISGFSDVDESVLNGAKILAETVLALTGAEIIQGITDWLLGSGSMADFSGQLAMFGQGMKSFVASTEGIDGEKVKPVAEAAKALAEMAAALPNSGGVLGFLVGENDMDEFAAMLPLFGRALVNFSNTVVGIDETAVEAGAKAGKVVAEMASLLPNTGGALGFFVGNNDMAEFGANLVLFGEALSSFSKSCIDLDTESIEDAATAGTSVINMASQISNSGGLLAAFVGDNDLSAFGAKLVLFGGALKKFSAASSEIDLGLVEAGATAGIKVIDMASALSSLDDGVFSVDLYSFAGDLALFALALADFSEASEGIDTNSVDKGSSVATKLKELIPSIEDLSGAALNVTAIGANGSFQQFNEGLALLGDALSAFSNDCANINIENVKKGAAEAIILETIYDLLYGTGGVWQLVFGEHDINRFADGIVSLGLALSSFSDSCAGINVANMTNGVTAAGKLSELQDELTRTGGFGQWVIGEKDFVKFSTGVSALAGAIKVFSDGCTDINSNNVDTGVTAAKKLIEAMNEIDESGGISGLLTGDIDYVEFGTGVSALAGAVVSFAEAMSGDNVSEEAVNKGVKAVESFTGLYNALDESGGLFQIFSGTKDLSDFSSKLNLLGKGIADFANEVKDIDVYSTQGAASASIDIATAINTLKDYTVNPLRLSETIGDLGAGLVAYNEDIIGLDLGRFAAVNVVVGNLIATIGLLTGTFEARVTDFINGLEQLANIGVSSFITAVENANSRASEIAASMGTNFASGIQASATSIRTAFITIIQNTLSEIDQRGSLFKTSGENLVSNLIAGVASLADGIKDGFLTLIDSAKKAMDEKVGLFRTIGRYYVLGLCEGLANSTYLAKIKATALAKAVDDAVRKELGIHSPGKKGIFEGEMHGTGVGDGLESMIPYVTSKGKKLAKNVTTTVSSGLDPEKAKATVKKYGNAISDGLSSTGKITKTATYLLGTYSKTSSSASKDLSTAAAANEKFSKSEKKKTDTVKASTIVLKGYALTQKDLTKKMLTGADISDERSKSLIENGKLLKKNTTNETKAAEKTIETQKKTTQESKKQSTKRNAEAKKSGKERVETQKEINQESIKEEKSYWRQMLELQNQASDEASANSSSIFSEISDDDEKSKSKTNLTKILEDRIDLTQKFLKVRSSLESKLKGTRLWTYLASLGEDNVTELNQINSMTEEKLKKYADLYEKYYTLGITKAKEVLTESDLVEYQADILDKTTEALKTYTDALESATQTYVKSSSIFDSVEQQEGIAPQTLMNNLDAQITYFDRFTTLWTSLKSKLENGDGSDLWEDVVKDLGVDDINKLQALNMMSDEDLTKYVTKYNELMSKGKQLAAQTIKDTKEETEKTLTELYGVNVDLDEFMATFDGTFASIDTYVSGKATATGTAVTTGMSEGIAEGTASVEETAKESVGTVVKTSAALAATESPSIGANFVQGFADGITSNASIATSAAAGLGTNASEALKSSLGIASPSKVMYVAGRYSVMGFVNGLSDFASGAYSAGDNMGEMAKQGLLTSVANIAELVDGSIDYQPTIRPVLDLSNVKAGSKQLSNLFSSNQAMTISSSMNKAFDSENQNGSSSNSSGPVYQFTQNNYSPKALSRLDIYRQTKNQFSTLKGLV